MCGLSVMSMCGLSVMKTSELICLNIGDVNLLLCNGHPLFFSCDVYICLYAMVMHLFSPLKKINV
jgi:hypothetical protein